MAMRSLGVAFLFALSVPVSALAKVKPRITIQVVNSETTQREYTRTMPGRKGTSQTNCTTNGTTSGTINDYGVGPIQTDSTGNANTNCTTTTTAARPPQTHTESITQEHVYAILPDGRQVTLWCQNGFRRCDYLQPGEYEAQIDGNALFVFVHELSGKERKIKYRAVSVEEASVTAPPQPVSAASPPPPSNSAITSQAPNIDTPKEQAATDDAEIQFHIGTLYETGQGVPQDYTQAATWYRKAAEQGLYSAELNLGVLYATGQGVPQDYGEAYFWFDLAAAGPQTPAATKIAAENRDGAASHLTPADLTAVQERARKWFEEHTAKPQ